MQVGKTIYLDYQASTPLDKRVLEVMNMASETLFANPHAADHVLGWHAATAIYTASQQVADIFGINGEDVIFTSGASEANTMAIRTVGTNDTSSSGGELLIGSADHGSIINEASRCPLKVRRIPLNENGAPDAHSLENMLSEFTAFVSIVGVNNENGAIANLEKIGSICKSRDVILHVDLAQAPLAMELDIIELGIDFATISSHKLYGPKGIGALLIGPGMSDVIKPVIIGAGQQAGRRGGTLPTELIVGFGEACEIIKETANVERERVSSIRNHFVEILQNEGVAKLIGSLERRHPGNALMRFSDQDASELLGRLQPQIAASTQSACSSGSIEPSQTLLAMGLSKKEASECIRFSFGRYSTINQAETAAALILDAL